MRKVALIVLFCLLPALAFAEKPGFLNIPFGTSLDEVHKRIADNNEITVTYSDDDCIMIYPYMLGDMATQITLLFDHEDSFYGYYLKSPEDTADYFFSTVNYAKYITEVFKNKFGKPSKTYKPNLLYASQGATYSEWSNKQLDISTGFNSSEFKYYATGYVGSKKMFKAMKKFQQTAEQSSAKQAAGGL
jgi:hypothetical protein